MRNGRGNTSAKKPLSRGLRKAIAKRKLTAYATAKRAHVSVDAVQRFMKHERSLTLSTADKIADALDLKICEEDAPGQSK